MTPDGNWIIAVDFDGTLITGNTWPDVCGEPNRKLISFLIGQKNKGNKIILWTNRTDVPEKESYPLRDAVEFCRAAGLEFDAVNENLPEIIQAYGSDSRKVSADTYTIFELVIANRTYCAHAQSGLRQPRIVRRVWDTVINKVVSSK